jgi:hypothetical protein
MLLLLGLILPFNQLIPMLNPLLGMGANLVNLIGRPWPMAAHGLSWAGLQSLLGARIAPNLACSFVHK